jgi:hypothetical protein
MIITIKEIMSLCNKISYERGLEYYKGGRVNKVEFIGDKLKAIVAGTYNYEVTVKLDKGIKASCTCPYDWGGYCKHIVATLMLFSENYDKIKKSKIMEENRITKVMNNILEEEMKDFLLSEFENNPTLRTHFLTRFSENEKEKSITEFKKDIKMLYREAEDPNGFIYYGRAVDFSPFKDLAVRYLEKRDFLESAKIYRALSEVIAEKMGCVDDSDGYYGGEFSDALQDFAECIRHAELEFKDKKRYIDYFFNQYIKNDPDYFQEFYESALMQICSLNKDFEYLRKELKPYIPEVIPERQENWRSYYEARKLVALQLFILEKLNSKKEIYDVLENNWDKDEDFCLTYVSMLKKDGNIQQSVRISEEGIKLFPDHLTGKLRIFLNRHYKKYDPEKYKLNLKNLFYQEKSWNHYDTLKKIVSKEDWVEIFNEIIKHFTRAEYHNSYRIIDIYLREEMFEKALRTVINTNSLDVLNSYHGVLSDKYPEQYYNAYQELILQDSEKSMGRSHYRKIAAYLKRMKSIKGFKSEFEDFIKLMREKYRKRPAFLDEIKKF